MKDTTILHTTSDTANFSLGAATAVTAIVVALAAKKRIEKLAYKFVAGTDIMPEGLKK